LHAVLSASFATRHRHATSHEHRNFPMQPIDMKAPMICGETVELGTLLIQDRRAYRVIGFEPYTKLDGTEILLVVWRGNCATCGEVFITKSAADNLSLGVRCAEHKRPGLSVKAEARQRRKEAAAQIMGQDAGV